MFSRRHLVSALPLLGATPAAARSRRTSSAPPATPQTQPLLLMTGEIDGTFARIGADLAEVITGPDIRVMSAGSAGSLDNLHGLVDFRAVDLGLVAADTLAMAKAGQISSDLDRVQFISKLFDAEMHIVARDSGLRTLADLRGKRVNIDVDGSGTAITALTLFALSQVGCDFRHDSQARGALRLRQGELDALCYLVGKPAPLFRRPELDGCHFVEVPYRPALQSTYLPAHISSDDYPGIIESEISTIAVGVVLACIGWEAGSSRFAPLARFCRSFLQNFPTLQQAPYHPKWREVDVSASVAGWTRFAPVSALLQASSAPPAAKPGSTADDGFDTFLRSLGRRDLSGDDLQVYRKVYLNLHR